MDRLPNSTYAEASHFALAAWALLLFPHSHASRPLGASDPELEAQRIYGLVVDEQATRPLRKKILVPLAKSEGFCFPTPEGDRYYEQPKRAFYQILKKAALKGVGWHTLRKTFGSELARQGVSLLKIQKWMGHSDPRITMQHYAHLSPAFDEDINKIGKSVPA